MNTHWASRVRPSWCFSELNQYWHGAKDLEIYAEAGSIAQVLGTGDFYSASPRMWNCDYDVVEEGLWFTKFTEVP
jgi:hypothetical protein